MSRPLASGDAAIALSGQGPFCQNIEGFTPRHAQQEMAHAVAEVLAHGGTLVAESGTGTGKTFAYLVPIFLEKRRTIISTGTKHLQDQIFHRDIPTVARVLGRPAKAVMLKGRSNYLCRYRLKQCMHQSDLIGRAVQLSFDKISRWANTTRTGDIGEVSEISEQAPIWKEVTSTPDNCLGGKCPDYKKCYLVKARQQAMEAEVVVVNHHLFFSDLTLKDDGFGELLPSYDAVVFDEAHSLGEIASNFFGFAISSFQIKELCQDTLRAEKEEQSSVDFRASIPELEAALEGLQSGLHKFVDKSVELALVNSYPFQKAMERLQIAFDHLLEKLEVAAPAGEGLERCCQRAMLIRERLDDWLQGNDHHLVRWLSVANRNFRLHGTPLRISDRFTSVMGRAGSWIFTSATLAVQNEFSAFCEQLGLQGTECKQWQSPYDFVNNTLLYLPPAMPDPRDRGYSERLAEVIREVTEVSQGRAFCLFTSYAMMNQVYQRIKSEFDWPLMLQGEAPRSELMDRFGRTPNGVLFGTSSFWEGVDIKGDALSCVIIDKLPFAAPSDPVLKSRLQVCEEEGGNPFMDIQIPSAVIALKQGVGRLIRSETDKGVLVLCDPRISTKRYGGIFLQSLPAMPVARQLYDVQELFRKI